MCLQTVVIKLNSVLARTMRVFVKTVTICIMSIVSTLGCFSWDYNIPSWLLNKHVAITMYHISYLI